MSGARAAGLAVLLVGSLVAVAWMTSQPAKVKLAPVARTTPQPVASKAPEAAQLIPCRIVPRQTVWASTPATGQVEAVYVEPGQAVFDGQVLARIKTGGLTPGLAASEEASARLMALENSKHLGISQQQAKRLQQEVTAARVALARAEPEFQKQHLLHEAGATPRLVFEKARENRDRAATQLAAAEEASRQADNLASRLADEQQRLESLIADKSRASVAAVSGMASAEIHAPAAGVILQNRVVPQDAVTDRNRAELFQIAIQPQLLRAEFDAGHALPQGQAVALLVEGAKISSLIGETGAADFESRTGTVLPGTPCSAVLQIK